MTTLEDCLRRQAQLYPDKPAVVCAGLSCSYSQLLERALRRAETLREQRGKVVLLRATPGIDFFVEYFAIHLAGAVAAPLERDLPDSRYEQTAAAVEGCEVADGTADVLYTTGTTGRQKGVMISHRTIMANAENLIEGQGFSHDLTFVVSGPLNHLGSLSKLYPVIAVGATLLVTDGLRSMDGFFLTLDHPARKMATFFVPATLSMLLHFGADRLAAYAEKLEFIECGGAPLPHADMLRLCRLLPRTRLYNTYASTETGIVSTYNFNDGRCLPGCLGRPLPHSRISISPEGRICCQGDTLMSGYLGDRELTATVLRNNTVSTADLGSIDAEGMLHIGGREDDVINVGGYKVAPTEVEDAARLLPEIADCICIATAHAITGHALKLLVVMAGGSVLDKRRVAQHLSRHLERYKVPMLYEQTDRIERTYNGKLNRKHYRLLSYNY